MNSQRTYDSVSGGIFLIGLGLLFLVPGIGIWPWILAVIGAAGLPASLAHKRGWLGWQAFFWLVGLAVLFATDLLWPGILILIGVSSLVGALTRESPSSPFAGRAQPAAPPQDEPWPAPVDAAPKAQDQPDTDHAQGK